MRGSAPGRSGRTDPSAMHTLTPDRCGPTMPDTTIRAGTAVDGDAHGLPPVPSDKSSVVEVPSAISADDARALAGSAPTGGGPSGSAPTSMRVEFTSTAPYSAAPL